MKREKRKIQYFHNEKECAEMRLDKYLSDMGIASRSDLKNDISKGLVFVNGEMIRDAGFTVNYD